MHARRQTDHAGALPLLRSFRPMLGALLLLLLGWGSAAPAHAEERTIDGEEFGQIIVNAGDTLTIGPNGWVIANPYPSQGTIVVNGGTLNVYGAIGTQPGGTGVIVNSGAMNMYGGSVNASVFGVRILGGSVSISGGWISGPIGSGVQAWGGSTTISGNATISGDVGVWAAAPTVSIEGGSTGGRLGVLVESGNVSITGGSISGSDYGVHARGGTVRIYGCPLALEGSRLIGTLQRGASIDTLTLGLGQSSVVSTCEPPPCSPGLPQLTCPANLSVPADSGLCTASVDPGTATASDNCSQSLTVSGARNDGQPLTDSYPVGTTTITWTAINGAGSNSCNQTITVQDTSQLTITCPANIIYPADQPGGARVGWGPPTVSGNCREVNYAYTPGTGSLFPVGTTIVNCTATDAAGHTATCSFTVTIQPRADLALTMSASPSPVQTGSSLTYTLVVQNNGPQAAQGVTLTDSLPTGTSFVSASRSANLGTLTTPKGNSSTLGWSIPTLASGQSVTLTVVVKASAKAGDTISNTASVSSSGPLDSNSANNSATVITSVVAKR